MTGKKKKAERAETRTEKQPVSKCAVARVLLVAALLALIGYLVHMAEAILTMDYYLDPAYFDVWSKVMMPEPGLPPAEFTYLSLIFGFAVALIYIWAYKMVEPALDGLDGRLRKGLFFGVLLFVLGVVPGSLSLYLLVNIPSALIGWWTLSGLVVAFIDGVIIARFC
jgi:hypothetical protein